jgi:hypothetical protein
MQLGPACLFRSVAIYNPAFLALLAFLFTPITAPAKELPDEFSATYEVEAYGMVLASATHTVEHTDNGLAMEVYTRPAGLAALILEDEVVIRADLESNNGQLLLVNYDYKHTGDKEGRNDHFRISWENNHEKELSGTATGVYKGEKFNMNIDQPLYDPLSVQALIITNAGKKIEPQEYGLFLKGELKHYLFENHGIEKIRFNEAEYTAAKTAVKETDRDRVIYVWMIPELKNVPIKYERWKNGKLQSTVLLRRVTFEENGRTKTLDFTYDEEDFD